MGIKSDEGGQEPTRPGDNSVFTPLDNSIGKIKNNGQGKNGQGIHSQFEAVIDVERVHSQQETAGQGEKRRKAGAEPVVKNKQSGKSKNKIKRFHQRLGKGGDKLQPAVQKQKKQRWMVDPGQTVGNYPAGRLEGVEVGNRFIVPETGPAEKYNPNNQARGQ